MKIKKIKYKGADGNEWEGIFLETKEALQPIHVISDTVELNEILEETEIGEMWENQKTL